MQYGSYLNNLFGGFSDVRFWLGLLKKSVERAVLL